MYSGLPHGVVAYGWIPFLVSVASLVSLILKSLLVLWTGLNFNAGYVNELLKKPAVSIFSIGFQILKGTIRAD
jgi:hypothetical protein